MIGNTIFREEALARRSRQEPLEDRLQVTAPHEWVLVAGLGAALLALLAWGLFGSVERSLTAGAVLVRPGTRAAVDTPAPGAAVEALAFLSPTDAARIEPGMTAQVRIATTDRGSGPALPAVVKEVSARSVAPPAWLARAGIEVPEQAHQVRVVPDDDFPEAAAGAAKGISVRIVVGRSSLLSLVAPGRG